MSDELRQLLADEHPRPAFGPIALLSYLWLSNPSLWRTVAVAMVVMAHDLGQLLTARRLGVPPQALVLIIRPLARFAGRGTSTSGARHVAVAMMASLPVLVVGLALLVPVVTLDAAPDTAEWLASVAVPLATSGVILALPIASFPGARIVHHMGLRWIPAALTAVVAFGALALPVGEVLFGLPIIVGLVGFATALRVRLLSRLVTSARKRLELPDRFTPAIADGALPVLLDTVNEETRVTPSTNAPVCAYWLRTTWWLAQVRVPSVGARAAWLVVHAMVFVLPALGLVRVTDVHALARWCDDGDARACSVLALHEALVGRASASAEAGDAAASERSEDPIVTDRRELCDDGYLEACFELGKLYVEGRRVRRNVLAAADLFRGACDDDHAASCRELGGLYVSGKSFLKDVPKGIALLGRACDMRDGESCHRLAKIYAVGDHDVVEDRARAVHWFGRACDAGLVEACKHAGR